jgi:D-alanyl-D-alanine carboxypeptidase
MTSGKTSGSTSVSEWLHHAVDYSGAWLDYQTRVTQLPGCVFAVRRAGELVAERAFGVANLATEEAMTPRHRFRVASHSKTFTAAGIMRLRDLGRLRLDDTAGQWVEGLPAPVSAITIAQLLSHSGGLMRDGADAPHWQDRASSFDKEALFAELSNR